MKDRKLEKIINDSDKKIRRESYSQNTNEYINEYIGIVAKYVRKIKKEHPEWNTEKIVDYLNENMQETSRDYCKVGLMESLYYQYISATTLVNDKKLVSQIYEKVKDNNEMDTNYTYTANIEKNNVRIIEEMLQIIKEQEEQYEADVKRNKEILDKYKKLPENEKKDFRRKVGKSSKKIELASEVLSKDEAEKILAYIKIVVIPNCEQEIRERQKRIFKLLHNEYSKYGLLPKYISNYNSSLKRINMEELGYELSTGSTKENEVGLEEIFSEEFLDNISIDKMMKLSTFWQNRYAKEMDSINKAIFAIDTLELWDELLENDKKIELSSQEIDALNVKTECMQRISELVLRSAKESSNREITDEEKERGYVAFDIESCIERITKQEGEKYKKIFDSAIPTSENSLNKDLYTYIGIENLIDNTYKARNSLLMTQITELLNNKHTKNWGIVREEYEGYGEYRNTDSDKNALIYIDCEGFNMPLRLHIRKEKLIERVKLATGRAIIPEYMGDKDFVVEGNLIKNNVFMPMLKSHKKFISQEQNKYEGTSKQRFIKHLRYLKDKQNGRFPEHLMEKVIDKKGNITYKRPKTKYLDLETGKEYYLEDGKYVSVDDGEKKDGKEKF